jgi:CRP-like cAMP-binding protein
MHLIIQNVSKHISLDEQEKDLFLSMLQSKKVKRKSFLLQEGEVCRYSIYVLKGILRGYTIDENGFEHILQFAPQDWWIADMYSLITQQPGKLYIEALENSEVMLLSKKNLEQLYKEVPKFERFFRIITEKSLVVSQQRLLDNLSLTARQRYNNFCKRYPSLIDCLSQKYVAAYIGVTPEFLSKMLNEKNSG